MTEQPHETPARWMGLNELGAALAKFQAEMPTVPKTQKATVKSDKGSYSYTYAGLADVCEAAMPLLAKHGLSFCTLPGQGVLTGLLLHESGQSLTATLPINGSTPQQIGSSLTYMRRYLLGCMTGVVTDDDDDGRLAQSAPRAKPAPAPRPPQPEFPPAHEPLLLDTHSKLAKALYAGLRAAENAGMVADPKAYLSEVVGRPIASSKELTEDEARRVLDHLPTLETGGAS